MVLQYKFIYFFSLQFFQPSPLQYNCKACNTNSQYNLGNGTKPFLHFLSRFFFFFKLLENHPKIIFILFFPNTSNKFIKIYFHSFFFNFTHYKTLRKIFLHINNFFFTFPEYFNKFIKIYLIQFSSVLQLVKP